MLTLDFGIFINMKYTKIYYLHVGDNVPFYVGKTINEYARIASHKQKFGNDIKMFILEETQDWRTLEKYYIEYFKNQGYTLLNKNKGGGGSEAWTEESILKLRSHPTRGSKISKSQMGKSKSHKGRSFSKEHSFKIKQTRGFLKDRKVDWHNIPILQFDLEGNFIREWSSQKEATIFLSKTGDGIGACCRGKQKTAYGYVWKFKN